jgi:hypothetical protein
MEESVMGRKSLYSQAVHILSEQMALGESRREAKIELRTKKGDSYRFGDSVLTIHSYCTRTNYQQVAKQFTRWCVEVKGVHKYADFKTACEPLTAEYLQSRLDRGLTVSSVARDRSAFFHLFGKRIDFELEERTRYKITRSRKPKAMDRHFSADRNADLITIARAIGGRRKDIEKLEIHHFREIFGHLYVDFLRSKGGRNRTTPVRPDMVDDVHEYLERVKAVGQTKLFDRVHSKLDIHALRREYVQQLHEIISNDRRLRDRLLRVYPPRNEPGVKGDIYTTRDGRNSKMFDRDDLYLVSQALGHNRLDTSVASYVGR